MSERISAFFSYGFRPFFLFAGLYAVLAMAAWMAWIGLYAGQTQALWIRTDFPPVQWHAHEMLFGYAAAALAGFLLTATPGWTGEKPVSGLPLALLAGLWLLGRGAVWFSATLSPSLVAAMDLAFWVFLLFLVFKTLKGGAFRHVVFFVILGLLTAANGMVHLQHLGLTDNTMQAAHLLALDSYIVLIVVIGGRIVPSFTRNALRREGDADPLPLGDWPRVFIDRGAMVLTLALLVADLAAPGASIVGWIAIAAAIANGVRLAGWKGWRILDQPILWIVHLGYLWLVVGLALKGYANLSDAYSETTALHVLTVGAIGSMTLGIMTRAGLAHTGRPLQAPPAITVAYVILSLATIFRVAGPMWWPEYYNAAMMAAGAGWCLTFAIFVGVFWPILTRPRVGSEA
ncbi:MAG: NnrS family protein [Proteobacteria bacterium]|nr:NnrS family protein [Pseudomonadota bacterium]MDA1022569.1 NnrS family protein [Pseudomonadota bacterium]